MNNLELARKEISEIDEEMARLFERRMHACETVAAFKKERGLPVRDPVRERVMAEQYRGFISDSAIESYYVQFLKNTVNLSCDYQNRLMDGLRIAYSGVEGAYAQIAAAEMFPGADLIACDEFAAAYHAVETGEYDNAVLPLENSYAGEVGTVTDLIFSGSLYVNRVLDYSIRHCLIGLPDADLDTVQTVISHAQALEQCKAYIKSHGFTTENYYNTAAAAQEVLHRNNPTVAVIASKETAERYGLKVLADGINDRSDNTTRFAVVSRVPNSPTTDLRENENFILVFTVQNKAGSLAQTLNIIGAHGYNMRTLRSRPMKDLQWCYYFYIEAEGNIHTQNGKDMLRELSAVCAELKLVGTYYTEKTE